MEIGMWVLVLALLATLAVAAALGLWHDLTHRSRPAFVLALTAADHVRAVDMSNYYRDIHGTEW